MAMFFYIHTYNNPLVFLQNTGTITGSRLTPATHKQKSSFAFHSYKESYPCYGAHRNSRSLGSVLFARISMCKQFLFLTNRLFKILPTIVIMIWKFNTFGTSQLLLATGTCTPLSIANRRLETAPTSKKRHCNYERT
ncbi:MAG TPA: hypothetical protein ACFYD9_08940 [Candidatus Wunengus sp. YC64]|uniref:hypothetical protein n=1 Tax=Candidatus Wunengus sp. YC64 TaxID=3367700 RepID=UPI004025B823